MDTTPGRLIAHFQISAPFASMMKALPPPTPRPPGPPLLVTMNPGA
jgi:hypothetical protein